VSAASLAVLLALVAAGGDESVPYEKRATYDETLRASLDALHVPSFGPWHVAGPFPNPDRKGHATQYPPESGRVDLAATYASAASKAPVEWRRMDAFTDDGAANDLAVFERGDDVVAYAFRRIDCGAPRELPVALGSDDTLAVWLNGEKLLDLDVYRSLTPGEDRVVLPLRAGENQLLLKVANGGGGWQFSFEPDESAILDPEKDRAVRRLLTRDFPDDPRSGVPGIEAHHWEIEKLRTPRGLLLETTGIDFRADGALVLATRRGDVYVMPRALQGDFAATRFASGLHEPGGLRVDGDSVVVVQKPEITRLRDTDGDGAADVYETLTNAWGLSTNFHEFAFGPVPDGKGGFYGTLGIAIVPGGATRNEQEPDRGSVWHVDANGEFHVVARGLRAPNGIGTDLDGEIFFTDNQGDWVPACPVSHVAEGAFYGQRFALPDRNADVPRKLPACWLPYNRIANSATAIAAFPKDGSFGPFEGQLVVGDLAKASLIRVFLERPNVGGEFQGACFPMRLGFSSGVERFVFGPDKKLWVGETKRGWWSAGSALYGLERVRYTGVVPFEAKAIRIAGPDSFRVEFTKPVEKRSLERPLAVAVEQFTYHYWATYGSPEIETKGLAVESVEVAPDGLSATLRVPGLLALRIVAFRMDGVRSAEGDRLLHAEAYYTLNEFPR